MDILSKIACSLSEEDEIEHVLHSDVDTVYALFAYDRRI